MLQMPLLTKYSAFLLNVDNSQDENQKWHTCESHRGPAEHSVTWRLNIYYPALVSFYAPSVM